MLPLSSSTSAHSLVAGWEAAPPLCVGCGRKYKEGHPGVNADAGLGGQIRPPCFPFVAQPGHRNGVTLGRPHPRLRNGPERSFDAAAESGASPGVHLGSTKPEHAGEALSSGNPGG